MTLLLLNYTAHGPTVQQQLSNCPSAPGPETTTGIITGLAAELAEQTQETVTFAQWLGPHDPGG